MSEPPTEPDAEQFEATEERDDLTQDNPLEIAEWRPPQGPFAKAVAWLILLTILGSIVGMLVLIVMNHMKG